MDNNEILKGLDEEEQNRLKKIEKLDSNQGRKKIIFAGVTVFLIALFVFGTVFGGKYILSFEGSQALPEKEFAACTQTGAKALSIVDTLILETENYASVKLDSDFRVSIDGDSIKTASDGDDVINTELLKAAREQIQNKLKNIYSVYRHEGVYGEDFSEFLPDFEFPIEAAKTAELSVNEDNSAELIGKFTFEGCNYSEISSKPVYEIFDLDDVDDIIKSIEANYDSNVKINSLDIDYTDFDIYAYISREHDGDDGEIDRVTRLVYSRSCTVALNVDFVGVLAEYGTQDITFNINCEEEYRFSYVKFTLTRPVNFIEKGNSDEIHRRVDTDESAQAMEIVWESSDPDVLSVDEKGFYKGRKVSETPVTVRGTYTYNGVEYTDECLFYVRIPVESVKLSEKSVVMSVGEERTLEPTVKPENATLKEVYWFSTDESIVTVDNGVIKAVAPGEAGVYVITFDGNYKKTCAVTVEG